MHLTIDFETRSEADLRAVGTWNYSLDPSTEVLCLALKPDGDKPRIWVPKELLGRTANPTSLPLVSESKARELIESADIIEAHNVFFEKAIYWNVLKDWPVVPIDKWRCSAAKAAVHAIPRALDQANQALGLSVVKDKVGHFLMMKMCKPRKPTKLNKAKWHESPEDLLALFKYCIQDVEAEYALSQALDELNPKEQVIWAVDQQINTRGLCVDVEAAKASIDTIKEYETRLLKEFEALTLTVSSPKQVAATLEWLATRGVRLKDLTKASVSKALSGELPEDARRVLEIRKSLAKSSTAKFKRMVDGAAPDGRMRDLMMYHGAATGRWAGKGIQPHNMPRKMPDDYEAIIESVKDRDLDMFELLYGDPLQALSGCIRGFIQAAPGHELFCADYSSIEGRVLAWLAHEEYVLENYYAGKCAYCVFASQIYDRPYDEIYTGYRQDIQEYSDMRFDGKTGELACGYQGGEKAIKRFAPDMAKPKRKRIVKLWRENRPKTKAFWGRMENLAISAVQHGKPYSANGISWGMRKGFLCCRLPSGRLLHYYRPMISESTVYCYIVKTETGMEREYRARLGGEGIRAEEHDYTKPSLTFMGVNSETKKWERQSTYGGKLTENIVQAVARDLMAEAIVRLERATYPVVLHVHDEIISEIKEGTKSVEEFSEIMAHTPSWAAGCPVAAEGFKTKRYRKG